jgi:molybdopterin synthase catalytic subunit
MSAGHQEKEIAFFHPGAISPELISDSIARHSRKKNIGAHQLFLGQVREDEIDGKKVRAIRYEAYREMAQQELAKIRLEVLQKYSLTCAHILHSEGLVHTGDICFFVFVSAPHRTAVFEACTELVNRIKQEVPIFGKEIFEDESYQWKENKA